MRKKSHSSPLPGEHVSDWLAPPCHRKKAFTHPVPGQPATEQAFKICGSCPIIKECARSALTAGSTTDGCVQRPASGVIQAGVLCNGDHITAYRLARIAGVEMPEIRDTSSKNTPAPYCRSCGEPMVSWTRGETPQGSVMHYAQGFCTGCRAEYRRHKAEAEEKPSIYGAGRARNRFDKPLARAKTRRETQLALF